MYNCSESLRMLEYLTQTTNNHSSPRGAGRVSALVNYIVFTWLVMRTICAWTADRIWVLIPGVLTTIAKVYFNLDSTDEVEASEG